MASTRCTELANCWSRRGSQPRPVRFVFPPLGSGIDQRLAPRRRLVSVPFVAPSSGSFIGRALREAHSGDMTERQLGGPAALPGWVYGAATG